MAQDLEQLVLSISADTAQMRRALKRLEGDVTSSTRKVESSFNGLGKRVSGAFDGIGRSAKGALASIVAGFSFREAQQLLDSATRIENALKVAGLEGAELTKVYDQLFASAQRNAAPLESLATLYSRVAQAQDSLGASQAEMLNFTDKIAVALRVAGTDAQTASGALLQLSQALGGGIVRAEEFNSINEGMRPVLQAVSAGLKEAGGNVATLRQLVIDGKVSSEAFFRAFEAGSVILEGKVANATLTVGQAFTKLQNALIDTAGKLDEITGATDAITGSITELADFITALGEALSNVSRGPLSEFISALQMAATAIDTITGGPARRFLFDAENVRAIGRALGPDVQTTPKGDRVYDPASARVSQAHEVPVKPVSLADYKLPGDDKKARKKREDDYARETRQVIECTAALVAETEAQRQLNPLVNDYGYAAEKARMERELLTAAENAGKQITPELRAEIAALSEQYALAGAESERLAETQDQLRESMEELNDLGKDVMGGFIDDMIAGKSASEALAGALQKVGQKLLDIALNDMFSPKGGGGILSMLFGGGKTGFAGDILSGKRIGLFANGTNFAPGGAAIVGEKGPELVNLPRGSQVIPHAPTVRAMRGGAGSGSMQINVSVDGANGDQHVISLVHQGVARGIREFQGSQAFKMGAAVAAADSKRTGSVKWR